jgi:bifunctional DNA-binding transcriptional regulator/antitoxin component of YhaV-PrlF toxin-antitoxin module
MKDLDTMTVTKVGQGTLPKWWRTESGLSNGGVVEVRPLRDGKHSIVLTPRRSKRRGISGKDLLKQMRKCPYPIEPPPRHRLPFK